MSTAVSVLSPVSTQSLMPAAFRVAMASGTPSWSRSSTAVRPASCSSFSMSAPTCATRSLWFCMEFCASDHAASQRAKSAGATFFEATTKVRRPSCEKLRSWSSSQAPRGVVSKGLMMLSAPLVRQYTAPLCSQRTDIRFLSALNSMTWRSTKTRSPSGPDSTISSWSSAPVRRFEKVTPTERAPSTSATSSGLGPENCMSSLTCTV
mmetsp:Transcript_76774/g.183924  ORF Transcript_76774/g.183924 Transcript_76774/m.183924 type:complete len:207 (-) Transcript_76774:1407-2027(-)